MCFCKTCKRKLVSIGYGATQTYVCPKCDVEYSSDIADGEATIDTIDTIANDPKVKQSNEKFTMTAE
jgi:hypothetical protein